MKEKIEIARMIFEVCNLSNYYIDEFSDKWIGIWDSKEAHDANHSTIASIGGVDLIYYYRNTIHHCEIETFEKVILNIVIKIYKERVDEYLKAKENDKLQEA